MISISPSKPRQRSVRLSLLIPHRVRQGIDCVVVGCAAMTVAVASFSVRAGEKGAWIHPERLPVATSLDVDPNDPYAKLDIKQWLQDLSSSDAFKRVAAADGLG